MTQKNREPYRTIIDRNSLPEMFPTHKHSPVFWETLGRTIATFGFLEDVLGRAIFSFTATRKYQPEEIDAAYKAWLPKLEKALTDQLWNLAESYSKAVKDNPDSTVENIDDLVSSIKESSVIRNVLCHGSWKLPDESGASVPRFMNRRGELFDHAIDVDYLVRVQTHVAELACVVVDTVTHMGWQFPGGSGPGEPIWPAAKSQSSMTR